MAAESRSIKDMTYAVLGKPVLAIFLGVLFSAGALGAQVEDEYAEDLKKAEESMQKGKFSRARVFFDDILEALETEPEGERPDARTVRQARLGLLRIDFISGEYEAVARRIGKMPPKDQKLRGFQLLLTRIHLRRGRYGKAIQSADRMIKVSSQDYEARYLKGVAMSELGRHEEARKVWQEAIDLANKSSVRDPLDLCYLARCYLALGGRDNVQMASAILVDSMRQGRNLPEARTTYGIMHFTVYGERKGFGSAESILKKVLERNGDREEALLGLYRSRRANMWLDYGKTAEYLDRCLTLNPNSVPAILERAKTLIDDRRFKDGGRQVDRALAINPRDKRALSHRATVAYLLHQTQDYARYRKAALSVDPKYSDLDRIIGDHLVALYRFQDAIRFYEAALKVDKDSIPAIHGLAKAKVYTGAGKEAVKLLNRAKELQKGYANPWRHNVLIVEDLLAKDYEVVDSKNFVFLLHKEDRAVLQDYLIRWHEEAREKLGKKYGYKPDQKVRVEVFHRWVDFSVRTVGFRGFSALGACFGPFVTLVSPRDEVLRQQSFMWSATVWHEYTHVLTLALSKHRIPRWLTEGLSVHEESAKNPTWERGMVRDLLDAYHNKEIAPVRVLNRVFRGPKILFGYYQGGLIVEFLSEQYGFDKVVTMLKAYGEDRGTSDIFRETFKISTREFDARFLEWVRTKKIGNLKIVPRFSDRTVGRLEGLLSAKPDDVDARLKLAWAYLQRQSPVDAGSQLAEVLRKDRKHGMANLLHGELLRLRKQNDAAMRAYERGFEAGADAFMARLNYAGLLEQTGDIDGAKKQYQFAKRCWPKCTDQALSPHLRLSRMLAKQGKGTEAMMELKAFCAMTARAFTPRLKLAEYEKKLGNREAEARFLEEAVQIDPFMRSLHDRLGDALVVLGRKKEALAEFKVGLAVPTKLDRAWLGQPAAPDQAAPAEAKERARLALKIAKLAWELGSKKEAEQYLDRVIKEASDSPYADEARELRAKWRM